MAKIKVTLEADLTDLKSYYPDDPKGVTITNVANLIYDQISESLNIKLMNTILCCNSTEETNN